nr:MAG TPA: hypothetical protein [Caudoviricetes sp.]
MSMNDDMTIYTEVTMLGQVFMGGYYDDSSDSFIIAYVQLKSAYDTKEYIMQGELEQFSAPTGGVCMDKIINVCNDIYQNTLSQNMRDLKLREYVKDKYHIEFILMVYPADKFIPNSSISSIEETPSNILMLHVANNNSEQIFKKRIEMSANYMVLTTHNGSQFADIVKINTAMRHCCKLYIDLDNYDYDKTSFNWARLQSVISEAKNIGLPIEYSTIMEGENRYLVKSWFCGYLISCNVYKTVEHIEQIYLTYPDKKMTTRIRKITIPAKSSTLNDTIKYYLTQKSPAVDRGVREENEIEISEETYNTLKAWQIPGSRIINKLRTNFKIGVESTGVYTISIDHYYTEPYDKWEYDVMEIEYHDPSMMTIANSHDIANLLRKWNTRIDPKKVIEGISYDITGISQFSNKSLACEVTLITDPAHILDIMKRAKEINKIVMNRNEENNKEEN